MRSLRVRIETLLPRGIEPTAHRPHLNRVIAPELKGRFHMSITVIHYGHSQEHRIARDISEKIGPQATNVGVELCFSGTKKERLSMIIQPDSFHAMVQAMMTVNHGSAIKAFGLALADGKPTREPFPGAIWHSLEEQKRLL